MTAGVLSLCLPLAAFVMPAVHVSKAEAEWQAVVAGASLGGTVAVAAVIGLFLAAIFLVSGLLSGRDPKVVYVQQAPAQGRRRNGKYDSRGSDTHDSTAKECASHTPHL